MSLFKFAIDRGGTFTDVFAEIADRKTNNKKQRVLKLLSVDPKNYNDAPTEGMRRVLEQETGQKFPRNQPLNTSMIHSIRMGTTVATNALLERKGERCALVVTKGFRDLLYIGNQTRPKIFDLKIQLPDVLCEEVVEVDEQVVIPIGEQPSKRDGPNPHDFKSLEGEMGQTATGEMVLVRKVPDLVQLENDLKVVKSKGINSLAVVLKHAAIYPDHEKLVLQIAQKIGFSQISISSQVMPMVKMVMRGYTAATDAYLTPNIVRYISEFRKGFDKGIDDVNILFMQSDGGLTNVNNFSGHKAILSGPAGGYVGYALNTRWRGMDTKQQQVIGFDMGGTSTDVSRYAGQFEHIFECNIAGVTIQAPQLDINTVAAGGGSRLFFEQGLLSVGPDSAGAHPGPVCYRKNGYLAVTDANLALGRIVPEFFPKMFGPNEDEPLDQQASQQALKDLSVKINEQSKEMGQKEKSADEITMGFIQVANESMCRPIRALTSMRGYDVSQHILSCFGGASGQHACAIAKILGITQIFIHRYSGILSAFGMALADVVAEAQKPAAESLADDIVPKMLEQFKPLEQEVEEKLTSQGIDKQVIKLDHYLNLRYDGTDVPLMVNVDGSQNWAQSFEDIYQREFGFNLQNRKILIDDIRVRGSGKSSDIQEIESDITDPGPLPKPDFIANTYFDHYGRKPTNVYVIDNLQPHHVVEGPALLIDNISTIVVEPSCVAQLTELRDVRIEVKEDEQQSAQKTQELGTKFDPILLAIFSNRFMSIAEQMGRTLQRTSVSVNIKERLDFSCALFGPDGSLVANAPHIPVHLGAMSEAVKFQYKYWVEGEGKKEGLTEGDVLVSNHPQGAGGSHLPDITVITPVFNEGKIVFFVASRGHHADVGGLTPGSMPPHSKRLAEEGAQIIAFKLVKEGRFQEEGITNLLQEPKNWGIPDVVGTRHLSDNLSDLKAQIAANKRGINLVKDLIGEYSEQTILAYMKYVQGNAEQAVGDMLERFSLREGLPEVGVVTAQDQMDDGTEIKLAIKIDRKNKQAEFDFTGTGVEVYGNLNAPPAVTQSAILYSLRSLLDRDIPLNQGCLTPIKTIIPYGTLLNPSLEAGVVGGNVLTSQRVTDVILKAFKAQAASQGCTNNFTFGDNNLGYYETIGGGAGAGPTWHGRSAVQIHMTNTKITDPEILERRLPVVLKQYIVRTGSGGDGKFKGGNGIIREMEFLRPLTVAMLSERRSCAPFGLEGGENALTGKNYLIKAKTGQKISLGAKFVVTVQAGDSIQVLTPGGGGYGVPDKTVNGHIEN